MKVVLLAGGLGTRISEESVSKPKPMIEIGGKPLLWHIMKLYSKHGFDDFVICCGYKGYQIKEYFANYFLHTSDVTFDLAENTMTLLERKTEAWRVTLVDTGEATATGGRIKRVAEHLDTKHFCLTYGDGVSNVNVTELVKFHKAHGKRATITAVQPPGRFGALKITGDSVTSFVEKPHGDNMAINGGFFVLDSSVLDLITDDSTVWEKEPLERLAADGELKSFRHDGFWQPMDTLRDKRVLEDLWATGNPPWRA
jgi:glucose-1-phosphate cytidylyltransferase